MDAAGGGLLLALAVAGFASGVHCLGMCGGIVTAFAAQPGVPVHPLHASGTRRLSAPRKADFARQLAFNFGRIGSYAVGGSIAGWAGGLAVHYGGVLPAQQLLQVAANVMLLLAGLYLMGVAGWFARLEGIGVPLWRRLQPFASRALAARTLPQAWLAGLAWGWLPCGLVYGALAGAALAGSAGAGALAMLAFGLGTLPNLLAAGLAAAQLRLWFSRRAVRLGAGAVVAAFGVLGLAHASGIAEGIRRGLSSV